ncbi:MAG: hypothetical protein KC620_02660 [Myxococcales bacterium]|nr:hypothetical protein [Myxococcales bacterium]
MKALQIISVVILAAWIFPKACTTYIEPDEIGVRRSVFGGVVPEDLEPGHNIELPLLHTTYRLDRTLHYLEFTDDPASKAPALELRTSGDNIITVEATVVYRVIPGEGHKIIEEGFGASYPDKVYSVSRGFLLEHLGQLNNDDIQSPDERERVAAEATTPLNVKLRQYHVEVPEHGVVLRRIRFQQNYEERLQAKQLYAVQGQLDRAKQEESEAKQETDTLAKGIDKDVRIKREEWQQKIETAQAGTTVQIAEINASALSYDKNHRAEADARCAELRAEGDLAEAQAEALGQQLKAEALSTPAGRTYSAIVAARNFKLGEIKLNSRDPAFLREFASMAAWRAMFLAGSGGQ